MTSFVTESLQDSWGIKLYKTVKHVQYFHDHFVLMLYIHIVITASECYEQREKLYKLLLIIFLLL